MRTTLLIPALVATFATAAWAEPDTSPIPVIVADEGKVSLIDPDGTRTLADCRVLAETRFVAGPKRGQVEQEWKKCYLSFLTVHVPTGRWAVSASIMSGQVRLAVDGREYTPPTDKAGRLTQGDFIIMGDRNGVLAVSSGRPEAWFSDGTFYSQGPQAFTPDGSRVLVGHSTTPVCQWWSWSFAPRPVGIRVLPPGVVDSCYGPAEGELHAVLRGKRDVRIATLDPTGTKPWKIGPPLRQTRRKMTSATLLGDTLVFFREGEDSPENNGCEMKPGSYRRFELSTGVERTFHTFEDWCVSLSDVIQGNVRRRTVYFYGARPDPVDGGLRLYEYDLERDASREIEIESLHKMHDISADGRTLLLSTYPRGLVLYDVDSSSIVEVGGIHTKEAWAYLIAPR
ncbi:hypothetical protein JY651_47415 [Pyxidicoccus parkwayensis]|uniref:Lipoprotein n=1 Tax=Pyxidicoccus parkwayensis TaxID=2813578 RepID=A0ABX7NZ21_9BACT|nr:hypothetical protein [Pyxidicoccus parkwaysis]QSQ22654.1 hypothetical protein JY651_47415 [Pyxidicoccus parkwaysis]